MWAAGINVPSVCMDLQCRQGRIPGEETSSRIVQRLTFSASALVLIVAEPGLRLICPVEFVAPIREARNCDAVLGVRKRPKVHQFRLADFREETIANSNGASSTTTTAMHCSSLRLEVLIQKVPDILRTATIHFSSIFC